MSLLSAVVLLILVFDPFGNIPYVVSALKSVPAPRRARVVMRECLIAYAVLVAFLFGGKTFLDLLGLSEMALTIAGGVILFLIALRMAFPGSENALGEVSHGEPLVVPIAIPAIAGPSALATVLVMASREPSRIGDWLVALTAAMAVSVVVLVSAERISRYLGERGIIAMERLMGLILTAIAIEMLLSGMQQFIAALPPR